MSLIYLYITPSGSVNLIEGEKMPDSADYAENFQDGSGTGRYDAKGYEDALKAAKASSVPVDDQERAKAIIYTSKQPEVAHLSLKPDTIYGPFDIGHEIKERCIHANLIQCPTCTAGGSCTLQKVAILLPEKEPDQVSGRDFFQTIPACNWEEDYAHENGNYINKCSDCGFYFKGHKRRVRCKICSGPDWEKLSQKQAPKELPGAYHGCWLEGEMVGYARCMVRKVLPLQAELAGLQKIWDEHHDEAGNITPSNSGELKLTPEQVKEREEAINWYRGGVKQDTGTVPYNLIARLVTTHQMCVDDWNLDILPRRAYKEIYKRIEDHNDSLKCLAIELKSFFEKQKLGPVGKLEEKEEPMPNMIKKGVRKRAQWLNFCLSIGWRKDQLDSLGEIWDKNHDESGNLI